MVEVRRARLAPSSRSSTHALRPKRLPRSRAAPTHSAPISWLPLCSRGSWRPGRCWRRRRASPPPRRCLHRPKKGRVRLGATPTAPNGGAYALARPGIWPATGQCRLCLWQCACHRLPPGACMTPSLHPLPPPPPQLPMDAATAARTASAGAGGAAPACMRNGRLGWCSGLVSTPAALLNAPRFAAPAPLAAARLAGWGRPAK